MFFPAHALVIRAQSYSLLLFQKANRAGSVAEGYVQRTQIATGEKTFV